MKLASVGSEEEEDLDDLMAGMWNNVNSDKDSDSPKLSKKKRANDKNIRMSMKKTKSGVQET